MSDFIAFDVETANADLASICSIGLVQFRNGLPIKRLHYLINPDDHFDGMNIGIHGITPEMVTDAPKMNDVYPLLAATLQGQIVVHHMPFDRTAMRRAGMKHGYKEIECSWLDTARVARRTWSEVAYSGYALNKLAHWLSIAFNHHDAVEDAFAAGVILVKAIEQSSCSLDEWLLRALTPLSTRNPSPTFDGNPDGPLGGESIVFTGRLNMTRHEAATLASISGCQVTNSVSKKTTILIVGEQDIRLTKGEEKSTKHRKAESLILAGTPIRIIGESDFLAMVAAAQSTTALFKI